MNTDKTIHIFGLLFCGLILLSVGGCGGDSGSDFFPPLSKGNGDGPAAEGTISGTVSVLPGRAFDSDVNDSAASYAPNDDFDQAQVLPNPVVLAGYVNQEDCGSPGRSCQSGDLLDVFLLTLDQGQGVVLYMAEDPAQADLDLYLFSESLVGVDSSDGTGHTEYVEAPSTGTYYVCVSTYEGASNYYLATEEQPAATVADLRLGTEFVPGEVIVRFRDEKPWACKDTLVARAASVGLIPRAGAPGRSMLMDIGQRQDRPQLMQTLGISRSGPVMNFMVSDDPVVQDKIDTLLAIKALRKRADVLHAEPNYIERLCRVPDDTFYGYQWHYPLINLPQAWDISIGAPEVIVAVIDTGVLLNHPDLQGQLVPGYDFISDLENARDGDGIDDNPNDPGDDPEPGMSSFHGTHVAGTVAAASDNDLGVAGIAWSARIMPLRAGGALGFSQYDTIQAIRFAAGLENDSLTLPPQRADIINCSFGGDNPNPDRQTAIQLARDEGVIVIAAVGNDSSRDLNYPSASEGVISVSAVDLIKEQAPYSNFGESIDVAAPGGDASADLDQDGNPDGIFSTCGTDRTGELDYIYQLKDGTSMASPHMAGVVALMKSVHPELSPQTLDMLLAAGEITEDLGDPGRDDIYGSGLIDAYKAVTADAGSVPPILAVRPSGLHFGLVQTSAVLSAGNDGGADEEFRVSAVSDDAAWLNTEASNVDDRGLGEYTVTVNRSGLSDGIHGATITFVSTENTVDVQVDLRASNTAGTCDAGCQCVMLIDAQANELAQLLRLEAHNGRYEYNFENVPSGTYKILASSDCDNDSVPLEPGEFCGFYRSPDDIVGIDIDGDISGLDFDTGYLVSPSDGTAAGVFNGIPIESRK